MRLYRSLLKNLQVSVIIKIITRQSSSLNGLYILYRLLVKLSRF